MFRKLCLSARSVPCRGGSAVPRAPSGRLQQSGQQRHPAGRDPIEQKLHRRELATVQPLRSTRAEENPGDIAPWNEGSSGVFADHHVIPGFPALSDVYPLRAELGACGRLIDQPYVQSALPQRLIDRQKGEERLAPPNGVLRGVEE